MRGWLQRTDQFDWFSIYLADRGLQTQWRLATFVFTAFLSAVPVLMLASSYGPNETWTRAIAVTAGVAAFAASTVWLFRWPTRTRSLIFNAVCSLCVAAGCLVLSNPYGGLMGTTMFAAVGGFLAYFHALLHVLANFGLAMVCTAINAGRLLAETGDIPGVAASVLLVVAINLGVPFGIHLLVHSLHADLRNSDRDPLTGLLNRRSFYNTVHELVVGSHKVSTRLNVTMIDLDDFKRLNDTLGHAVGDDALVEVSAVLQESCGSGTVLARLGGEEFVIADTDITSRHLATAERIRTGIAAMPFDITASLGSCSATIGAGVVVAHPEFLDRLLQVADSAMYESKRAGGNRGQHRYLDD